MSVRGAPSADVARGVGKAVVNSPLFKSAVAGNDPNVGRLVSSIGSYLGRAAHDLDLGACTAAMGGRIIFAKGEVGGWDNATAKADHEFKTTVWKSIGHPACLAP